MYRLQFESGDGERIGEELQRIAKKHGDAIRPEHVVERARDPKSALHHLFEWNNSKAADEYRLHQAREILRKVVIVRDEEPDRVVRAFVNIDRGGAWVPIGSVLGDKDRRKLLLKRALDDLNAAKRRYEELGELQGVWDAINAVGVPEAERKAS